MAGGEGGEEVPSLVADGAEVAGGSVKDGEVAAVVVGAVDGGAVVEGAHRGAGRLGDDGFWGHTAAIYPVRIW